MNHYSSLLVQSWKHLWWGVNHWDHREDTYVVSHPFDETPPPPHLQITHWTRRARCVASRMGNHGTMPALCDFQWECSQPPYNSMSVTASDLTVKTALPEGIQGNFWAPSSPPLLLILKHRTSWNSAVCSDDKRRLLADEDDSLCLFEYFLSFLNIITSWKSPPPSKYVNRLLRLLCFWTKIALCKGSQASPACPDKGSIKMKTNLNHWWNDAERGETKCSENILSQGHFVHLESHMDCRKIEPVPLRWVSLSFILGRDNGSCG